MIEVMDYLLCDMNISQFDEFMVQLLMDINRKQSFQLGECLD